MHELSVCEALLAQVRSTAEANGASEVGRITVRLGPLSGVEPDLLAQAFTIARNGPMTARASLEIETQPVRIRCRDCGNENEAPSNRLLCSACNSYRVDLISGDELLLARVELQGVANPPNPSTESKASPDHV
ncbi:MAG: hydrogenase maturation nickel metallochaperone HypA [Wenzhouxiangella sp.]|jgi:hydrogenase nickel incorporation protein HypA/HybF|nr:hydrogenase maturation nickel metallochaperone HypA [Wenzhouxiangella sp.]